MVEKEQYPQKITFTVEFLETFKRFIELIKHDKNIQNTILERDKMKGMFSPAIRYLIAKYVDSNWSPFVQSQKQKLTPNAPSTIANN